MEAVPWQPDSVYDFDFGLNWENFGLQNFDLRPTVNLDNGPKYLLALSATPHKKVLYHWRVHGQCEWSYGTCTFKL